MKLFRRHNRFLFEKTEDGALAVAGYAGDDAEILIPEKHNGLPVSAVADGAFAENMTLTAVTVPDSVIRIGEEAFRDCGNLERVRLSGSLTDLPASAFRGCVQLASVNIPDAMSEVRPDTFRDCPLRRLEIGSSLRRLDPKPFHNGDYYRFTGNRKNTRDITELRISPLNRALKIEGPAVLSADGKILYAVLRDLTRYEVPDGVEVIAGSAFEGLYFLEQVRLPESLRRISRGAFAATGLTSLHTNPGLRVIEPLAFDHCRNLTGVTFEPGIEEIGDRAFQSCPLKRVHLPASVRSVGNRSFYSLSKFHRDQITGFTIDEGNRRYRTDGRALYEVSEKPGGTAGEPAQKPGAEPPVSGAGLQLNSLFGRDYRGFLLDGRHNLSDYQVLPGTRSIGPGAFAACNNLGGVSLPEGLETIGESAFAECDNLPAVRIPDSVREIREHAFRGTAVKSFVLPEGLAEIGMGAFAVGNEWDDRPSELREIRVADGNPHYYTERKMLMRRGDDGNAVLASFAGEDEIAIPEDVTEICPEAFYKSPVKELWIPASVKKIGERAFAGCRRLRMLHIGFGDAHEQYAAVYIPDVRSGRKEHGDEVMRETIMNCVTIGEDSGGTAFDFATYDGLFDSFDRFRDKMFIASERLRSGCMLTEESTDMYRSFLRNNAKAAMEFVISAEDLETLAVLAELEVFTEDNIDELIELVNRSRKVEILSFLLDFKNRKNGVKPREEYDFSL
ncbi:MAG: leucine-rich repeat domain-containing protein [Clostridia bacterium]|nr:leucine-rich repeat domain-containing protein [Clostridia bacterium]